MPPTVKALFITNLVPRKVEKENHIRKVWKSEERKVKNIGKIAFHGSSCCITVLKVHCITDNGVRYPKINEF